MYTVPAMAAAEYMMISAGCFVCNSIRAAPSYGAPSALFVTGKLPLMMLKLFGVYFHQDNCIYLAKMMFL